MTILDHQLLRMALAHFVGQELTPEAAGRIEDIAMHREDLSQDPARFGLLEHDGYTIRVERFRDIVSELDGLHRLHWVETEKHRHGVPFNPDYKFMARRERDGALVQFTVRHGGELVGNLRVYLGISLHSGTPICTCEEDTLFMRADHRGGWVVMKLLRFAEDSLKAIGVREFNFDSKVINRADVLMRRMGYTLTAHLFTKTF